MKRLLAIIGMGTVAFVAVAMAQEWEVFAVWLGRAPAPAMSEAVRSQAVGGAERAVEGWISMMRHLYGSGGDRRFSERAPASEAVLAATLFDIEYLARTHRRQVMDLIRLEKTGTLALSPKHARVATREYWVVHTLAPDGRELEPEKAVVAEAEYHVAEENRVWVVVATRRSR
ncbi:MAG: hypothetical protein HY903_11700 [Deltaproteobacteria bacterium]|nr:hypothetical protein [Deltaproteobacteria bacterium]